MHLTYELPSEDEKLKCSDFNLNLNISPAGTAFFADKVVTLEAATPWPSKIAEHPAMQRLETIEPKAKYLLTHAVETESASRREYIVNGDNQLTTPTVLVCTHGSRDSCCGNKGITLVNALRDVPKLDVLRVSHLGGHRFAPTALTLPDGRMWANLIPQDVIAITSRKNFSKELGKKCRGWIGLEPGTKQVAELAIFNQLGFDLDAMTRNVEVIQHNGPETLCKVSTNAHKWIVKVSKASEAPVISCKSKGGLPVKQQTVYEAEIL